MNAPVDAFRIGRPEFREDRVNVTLHPARRDAETLGVERHVNAIFAKLGPSDPERVNRRVHAALTYLAAEGRLPDRARSLAPVRS